MYNYLYSPTSDFTDEIREGWLGKEAILAIEMKETNAIPLYGIEQLVVRTGLRRAFDKTTPTTNHIGRIRSSKL